MKRFPAYRLSLANSLAEYLIPAAIFVGILLVTSVSFNWGGAFQESIKKHLEGDMENQQLSVENWGTIRPPEAAKNLPPLEAGQEYLCFSSDNVCFTVSSQLNETVGSLGEKNMGEIARFLQQVSDKLDEADYPEETIQEVTDLANQSHSLAERMKALAGLCPAGTVCSISTSNAINLELAALNAEFQSVIVKNQKLAERLEKDPNALPVWAKALIAGKVNEIKNLVQGIGMVNSNQPNFLRQETRSMAMINKWNTEGHNGHQDVVGCANANSCTVNIYTHTPGVTLSRNPDSTAVNVNSNSICQQRGQTQGVGSCIRSTGERVKGKLVWDSV